MRFLCSIKFKIKNHFKTLPDNNVCFKKLLNINLRSTCLTQQTESRNSSKMNFSVCVYMPYVNVLLPFASFPGILNQLIKNVSPAQNYQTLVSFLIH